MDGLEPVKEKAKIWSACKVVRFHRSKWRRKRSKIWYRANYWCLYDSSIVLPFTRVFHAQCGSETWTSTRYPLNAKIYEMIQKRDRPNTDHHSYHAF